MPRYWFRQKQFGYGATPNTWQGWLFTIAGVVGMAAVIFGADAVRDNTQRLLLVAIGVPVVLIPFVLIAHAKTEGGWRWKWGPKN
jgi:hypothetical protein